MKRSLPLVVIVVLIGAGVAHADKADKLFQKGKKLLAEKKYAEACPTFEQVDKIDPGIGAKLNVAKCYEDWGRLATAYRWYADAQKMATAANDDRVPKIKELIDELDANVPRVTIKVPDGADPDLLATLMLDGKPVDVATLNSEQRVDPGPHLIEFTINGVKRKKMAPVERGGSSEISLDIPKGTGKKNKTLKPNVISDPVKKPDPEPEDPPPPDPGKTRRIIGISMTAAGGVGIAIAIGMTLSARGKYKDALADHCMGSTTMCDPTGLRITGDARSTANQGTVVALIGAAMVGGGLALYFTAPKAPKVSKENNARYLVPVLGDDGAGVAFGGSF